MCQTKHFFGAVGQSDDVFQGLVGGLFRKVFTIELGAVAQEIFLDAKGLLVGADEDYDKDWVWLAGGQLSACDRRMQAAGRSYSHENLGGFSDGAGFGGSAAPFDGTSVDILTVLLSRVRIL